MKTKTKTKSKTARKKPSTAGRKKTAHYPAPYLAAALAGVLLLEGFLLGAASPVSWERGLSVLDVSEQFNVAVNDFLYAISPMLDQVTYVGNFYRVAAAELAVMLESVDFDPLLAFPKSLGRLSKLAAADLEQMLDFSHTLEVIPRVSGAAIFR